MKISARIGVGCLLCCVSGAVAADDLRIHFFANEGVAEFLPLDPATADFVCDDGTSAGVIFLAEDARFHASADVTTFQLFELPVAPSVIRVRRGGDITEYENRFSDPQADVSAEGLDDNSAVLDDWDVSVSGQVSVCAGVATLQIVGAEMAVTARVGDHQAEVFNAQEGQFGDISVRYDATWHSGLVAIEAEMPSRQYIGTSMLEGGYELGLMRLSFRREGVAFTSITGGEGREARLGVSAEFLVVMR